MFLWDFCCCCRGWCESPVASPQNHAAIMPRKAQKINPLRSQATVTIANITQTILCSRPIIVMDDFSLRRAFFYPWSSDVFTKSVKRLRGRRNRQNRENMGNASSCNLLSVRQYLQAYVMEKLFPILTISTCGTSLGMSWWWERAKRKTSYSCDSVGNNPPVERHRTRS